MFRLIIRLSMSGRQTGISKVRTELGYEMPKVGVHPAGPGGMGTGTWEGRGMSPKDIQSALVVFWEIMNNDPKHYPMSAPPSGWKIDHVWIYVEDDTAP